MRKNYPLLSQELNDMFQDIYYKLVYLLGYDAADGYTGLYDEIEDQIAALTPCISLHSNDIGSELELSYPGSLDDYFVYSTWGKLILINELRRL
jgi:hypothetical protein